LRIFIDACVDPGVAELFPDRIVSTAYDLDWDTLSDHEIVCIGQFDDRHPPLPTVAVRTKQIPIAELGMTREEESSIQNSEFRSQNSEARMPVRASRG